MKTRFWISKIFPSSHLGGLIITLLTLAFAGCNGTQTDVGSDSIAGEDPNANVASQKSEDSDVNLEIAEWKAIEALINEQGGKIVLVDFWSLSCVPCKREFPQLVALQKKYPDRLVCMAVNIDYLGLESKPPESYEPKVDEFLQRHKPTFACYLSSTSDSELQKLAGVTQLPTVKVFDADSKLVATIDESNAGETGFSYESDVIPLIDSLVKGLAFRDDNI